MSAKDQSVCNTDLLQASKFILSFPRVSSTQFFCQAVNIPGVSIASTPNQFTPFSDLPIPGDKIVYETFDVTFLIDEELNSWLQIHDWIKGLTFPKDFREYQNRDKLSRYSSGTPYPQYADAELTTLSASNNQKVKFHFVDTFPISVSGIDMDIRLDSSTIITATATFKYKRYDVMKI